MENSPYALRGLDHHSATGIKTYCECEVKSAYTRNFIGAPTPKYPVAAAYGTATHKLLEMTGRHWWKKVSSTGSPIPLDEGRKFVSYGMVFVDKVLAQEWGARGPKSEIIPLAWRADSQREELTEREYLDKIEEEKSRYKGLIYNTLEAFRLRFTVANNIVDMQFELDFTKYGIALPTKRGPIKIHGQIDRTEYYPIGYKVFDYKTGWIVKSYQSRAYIVEDLQMTIYHYVMTKLKGIGPAAMYIQPLEFSTDFLKRYGAEALTKKAIHVPDRSNPAFVEDLELLGLDVWEMVDMVVRSKHYSRQEREEWQPKSSYGKKAGFAESVQQARFVPRIGDWCEHCSFLSYCRNDHRSDWLEHEKKHQKIIPLTAAPLDQFLPITKPVESGKLFDTAPKRSIYLSKPKRTLRKEMLDSRNFVSKAKLKAVLNKIVELMRTQGTCDCLKLDLFPIWILPYLPRMNREHISIAEVCKNCPHENCPRLPKG